MKCEICRTQLDRSWLHSICRSCRADAARALTRKELRELNRYCRPDRVEASTMAVAFAMCAISIALCVKAFGCIV